MHQARSAHLVVVASSEFRSWITDSPGAFPARSRSGATGLGRRRREVLGRRTGAIGLPSASVVAGGLTAISLLT
jgi:hypothetical protein